MNTANRYFSPLRWRPILITCVLGSIPWLGFFGLFVAANGESDRGSPQLAEEWRAELSRYATPEEASVANPEIIVVRCTNGEWVFGLAQSSHGMWKRGGGTFVVKDSKGQIRAFFGHVCGPGHLGSMHFKHYLKQYYDATIEEDGFVEYKFE